MKPADQAVEELIETYSKLVFHTIYGMTGDWEESQDLTQDTFHQALKSIDAARASSGNQFREKAWLMSIALNIVRMQRRRRGIFRFIPFSHMQKDRVEQYEGETEIESFNERSAAVQPVGFGANEAVDPAMLIAERDAVQRVLGQLSETLRECLLLSIIGNFSSNEIAHMLNLQEAAVRQRLARARKQFQQLYALEISDNGTPATTAGSIQKRSSPTRKSNSKPNNEERTQFSTSDESYDALDAAPSSPYRSSYEKGFYRDPVTTPLW
jgi:RNA polymerase sigma-70 factor (ECF subfamily)